MRYYREVRFRFIGPREECKRYIPTARSILGDVVNQDIDLGGLDLAHRRVLLPDGTQIIAHAMDPIPILTIDVTKRQVVEEDEGIYTMRFVWKPEGIVLTPVSDTYEKGFGLPTRDPLTGQVLPPVPNEFGTPEGVWPQVILNRFANNKYLDEQLFISGLSEEIIATINPNNPYRRESWDSPVELETYATVQYWQPIYNPLKCPFDDLEEDAGNEYWSDPANTSTYPQVPGVYQGNELLYPQFAAYLSEDLIFEPEGLVDEVTGEYTWYTHRAEETLYISPAQEGCFQRTNAIRNFASLGNMHRPVRGHPNIARISVTEVRISGKQLHDGSEYFRPGYGKEPMRAFQALGANGQSGENLLITSNTGETFEAGVEAANAWRDSPPHYANQVFPEWTEDDDIPGGEHYNSYIAATVDETVYTGELDPPVGGFEWAQILSRNTTWVPTPFNHHDGIHGFAGSYGKVNEHDRDRYYGPSYLFVSFLRQLYAIPNEIFETEALGVFGVSTYEVGGVGELKQTYMRCVVCASSYAVAPTPPTISDFEPFTLYVLTRPVAVTDECDWTIEAQRDFPFAEGWVPAMQGGVKFSPDGSKFVFTMHMRDEQFSTALAYNSEDFSTATPLLQPRRNITLVHIEYSDGLFEDMRETAPYALVTSYTQGTPGGADSENKYERTLNGEIRAFADYDADGTLIFAKLVVQEYSYQIAKKEGGTLTDSDDHCYRIRKLVFPSGKEVHYMQQYMKHLYTVNDFVEISTAAWPAGDGTGDNFFSLVHYINVRDEDVVYTKRGCDADFFLRESALYPEHYEYGPTSIIFDGGSGTDRIQQTLYSEPEKYFADTRLAPNIATVIPGKGWGGVILSDTLRVYQNDIAPATAYYSVLFSGTTYYVHPLLATPTPGVAVNTDLLGTDVYTRRAYNTYAAKQVDYVRGRPPASNYRVSTILGLNQRWPQEFAGSGLWWGSSLWNESYFVENIAPIMTSEYISQCQVVRYKDRVVLRLENFMWPWPGLGEFEILGTIPGGTTPIIPDSNDVPEVVTDPNHPAKDWTNVPDEVKLLIWANFDIDAAVGISDVTDIAPFGRAG